MLEVTEFTQGITAGHPAITHLSPWRTPLAAQWELDPPERPSSMISRQEGDPYPWISESWFLFSQGW